MTERSQWSLAYIAQEAGLSVSQAHYQWRKLRERRPDFPKRGSKITPRHAQELLNHIRANRHPNYRREKELIKN